MTYKCKICGGQATIDSSSGVVICEYCGTKQALPLFTADSERLLYDRGNNYLNHSEYDKAENVFNQLLAIKPGAAELYWDLVLCKYGVTYVKDPKTDKYIPTCNRTHYTPIFSDENYKKAIELSSGEKKALFEEDAKTIDNIQKGIIAVSKKEKPFDIFISYKETDANGSRNKDSIEAQRLYEKLTEAGYKVFFSRVTLEDKIGTEYEPYIYAALYSSKVMLTICSSKENIEAVWVKNEWSRYLGFCQNDNSKTLLPLYFDMDKSDLPEEFALLSCYDMSVEGFEQELLHGIKKLIPRPISKAEKTRRLLLTLGSTFAAVLVAAVVLAAIFIPRYLEEQEAERQFIAEQQAKQEADQKLLDQYNAALALFQNAQYAEAAEAFSALGDYKDSIQMVQDCATQPAYDAAEQLLFEEKYAEATWAFSELGDYKDSAEQSKKAERKWRELLAVPVVQCVTGDSGYGSYYITPNGSVESLDGNGTFNFELDANGKAVSIASIGYGPLVLYENGYVNENNQEVIQITDGFFTLALKKDGRVVELITDERVADMYFVLKSKDITEWENIVELHYSHDWGEIFGFGDFYIVGEKADGTMEWVIGSMFEENVSNNIGTQLIDDIQEQKSIELLDYQYGKGINKKWQLVTDSGNKIILEDVVRYINGCIITKSGAIYYAGNEEPLNSGKKTRVYDVWLERN